MLPSWVKEVVENKTYGSIEWNLKDTERSFDSDVELYLSEKQKTGYVLGDDLREEMKDKNPVNLAFLQFFVENPKLYPKEWKGKYIYGWGTIVRNDDGSLYVPYLCEHGGEVVLNWHWLGRGWYSTFPALRFASPQNSDISPLEPENLDLESRIKALEDWKNNLFKI